MTTKKLQKTLTELRSLPGETEIVEFKEAKENFDFNKLGKYFSALSNEANLKEKPEAWLVFGVADKHKKIIGSNFRAGNRPYLDSLKSEIANKTTNRITFLEIYELLQPEGRVIMFQIPAAPNGFPVAWEGHYYGRDGEELAPLNLEKIERIRRQVASPDWSAEPCPRATLADLDPDKIENFIRIAQRERGFPLQPDTAIEHFLAHLKLIKDGKICNAALLAFGKQPQQFFTTAITKCARFYGLIVEKPIPAHKVFHGDVFEQVDAASDFIFSKIDVSVGMRTESTQAPIHFELPRPVVVEAIVNAVVHRDYTSNASVQVMLFKDRLKVFNPGYLTPRLNVQKLKSEHSSFPTNPMLAELMYLAGYIERFGTGTGEIFRLTKEAGLKEPEFDFSDGFNIIIWRPSPITTPQVPPKYPASTLPVQDKYRTSTGQVQDKYKASREIEGVLMILIGEMNRLQIQEKLGLKGRDNFIKNYLQPAINEGFIELTNPEKPNSPKQSYRLTEKGLELQTILRNK
jgi:predicted HTH transcriptional regulator